uniref:Uncharacterized protein n=1 Tax=Ascaris lumbricoides TaxID=6252 RepID=A0A0M3I9G0_ASCLU
MLRLNFNWAENALRITTLNDQHTGHDLSADSYAKIASKIRRCSPTSATPGVGKRPNQNYLPCGCRAMLRLNFNWAENALRITTLNDQHTGHDLSADSYAKIASKIRRCSPTSATPERSPVIRRPQAQHPLRNPTVENALNAGSSTLTRSPSAAATPPPSKTPLSLLAQNVAQVGCKQERSPVIRRPQAQHPLRNPTVENALNAGSSTLTRSPSAAATPPPSKTPLSLLAQNVAQVGCKQEPIESSSQNGYMSGGSQSSGALQNLTAVAAAINHQQQMAAVALFAHHKENMSFGFPNASMLPPSTTPGPQLLPLIRNGYMSGGSQSSGALQNLTAVAAAINHQQQMAAVALFAHHKENMSFGFPNASMLPPSTTPGPQLLPLIRGMLGLPNFASPLLLPTLQPLTTSHETQQQISTIGNAPRPAISAASPPATVSTTNGAVPTSTHQQSSPFISGYIGSQHEHLAAALSLAQQLRAQHFAPHTAPAPLQPNVVQPTSLMSVHAAVPTSQASVPLAHAATPIDLSTTPAPNTPTSNDERLQIAAAIRESDTMRSPPNYLEMLSQAGSPSIGLQRSTRFEHSTFKVNTS